MDFKLSFNTDLDPLNIIKKSYFFIISGHLFDFLISYNLKKQKSILLRGGGASEENMTKLSHSVAVHAIFHTREMSGNN